MEKGKRKREEGEEEEEVKKCSEKNKPIEAAETVTEEEVDEFFTVLRRMHVAVKYFQKSTSEVDHGGLRKKKWRKALEREVLEGVDSSVDGIKEVRMMTISDEPCRHQADFDVEESCCRLDLNALPKPEGDE